MSQWGSSPCFQSDLSLDLLFQGRSQGQGVPIARNPLPRPDPGYRTLNYEGRAPMEAYGCGFSRDFQTSLCIATYGMSVPSVHRESTSSVMEYLCCRQEKMAPC